MKPNVMPPIPIDFDELGKIVAQTDAEKLKEWKKKKEEEKQKKKTKEPKE